MSDPRATAWVEYAEQKLNGLDPLERGLARTAAEVILKQGSCEGAESAAAVVAIVEIARAVGQGKLKSFSRWKA